MPTPAQVLLDDGAAAIPVPRAEVLAERARQENFPVALRLLPARSRRHLMAIYGFARLTDELGDGASEDPLARLDALEGELDRAYAGAARHPVLRRLAPTLAECALPADPFRRLIEASRQDQRVRAYASWDELRAYCALSAEPVGELVLRVFGAATPERIDLSNDVCAALQLVEHCQDVAEDLRRGRVYLPEEDLARFGCPARDLAASRASTALRAVLRFQAERAAALLASGAELVASLRGAARLAVAGFVAGGLATVDALGRVDFDVLAHPAPRPRRRDLLRHAAKLLLGGVPRGSGGPR